MELMKLSGISPADIHSLIHTIHPFSADVNLDELYINIKKEISPPGLTWGEAHNKVPVAFGIFKLLISFVVFDDVSVCVLFHLFRMLKKREIKRH